MKILGRNDERTVTVRPADPAGPGHPTRDDVGGAPTVRGIAEARRSVLTHEHRGPETGARRLVGGPDLVPPGSPPVRTLHLGESAGTDRFLNPLSFCSEPCSLPLFSLRRAGALGGDSPRRDSLGGVVVPPATLLLEDRWTS